MQKLQKEEPESPFKTRLRAGAGVRGSARPSACACLTCPSRPMGTPDSAPYCGRNRVRFHRSEITVVGLEEVFKSDLEWNVDWMMLGADECDDEKTKMVYSTFSVFTLKYAFNDVTTLGTRSILWQRKGKIMNLKTGKSDWSFYKCTVTYVRMNHHNKISI